VRRPVMPREDERQHDDRHDDNQHQQRRNDDQLTLLGGDVAGRAQHDHVAAGEQRGARDCEREKKADGARWTHAILFSSAREHARETAWASIVQRFLADDNATPTETRAMSRGCAAALPLTRAGTRAMAVGRAREAARLRCAGRLSKDRLLQRRDLRILARLIECGPGRGPDRGWRAAHRPLREYRMKSPVSHQLSMTVLMTPDMANFSGNVHGGHILKLLDQVAYACASRYAKRYVVTLSVDQVTFRQPIHVGELVTFLASVNYTGTSSMEIGIKVVTENIRSQAVRHVNSCFFTMVAADDERKPVAGRPLAPPTPR